MRTALVLLLLQSGAAMAQSQGTFRPTGSMIRPRVWHTATLLPDGRVLIGGDSYPASAELYDPTTGTFSAIGSMTAASKFDNPFSTGTLLPDGRVLLTDISLIPALYDPSSGTFIRTGGMWDIHQSATLLNNGEVLMTGWGEGLVELYDPIAGTFTPRNMNTQGFHNATLLSDGRVLISNVKEPGPNPAEIYDPTTDAFSLTGVMKYGAGTMTLLTNGKVLSASGKNGETELYDASSGAFTDGGRMTYPRSGHTATLLPDGSVLMAGGAAADAELYDPSSGTFIGAGSMTASRAGHTATLLKDGRVLIVGGYDYTPNGFGGNAVPRVILSSAELFTPPTPISAAALLSLSGDGKGQGAIQHVDANQVVSADNPAMVGETIVIYCTGLVEGSVIPPQVAIGGRMAEVLGFGNTPGDPGSAQIKVRVPSGVAPGPTVSVRMNYMGRPSNAVTIGVK
jgi:hypothetical protein